MRLEEGMLSNSECFNQFLGEFVSLFSWYMFAFALQVAAFIPLMYMCVCTYYSLFKIGMLTFYSLTPRQTSSVSLLMICSYVYFTFSFYCFSYSFQTSYLKNNWPNIWKFVFLHFFAMQVINIIVYFFKDGRSLCSSHFIQFSQPHSSGKWCQDYIWKGKYVYWSFFYLLAPFYDKSVNTNH